MVSWFDSYDAKFLQRQFLWCKCLFCLFVEGQTRYKKNEDCWNGLQIPQLIRSGLVSSKCIKRYTCHFEDKEQSYFLSSSS